VKKLTEIQTPDELLNLHLSDLVRHTHIIVGRGVRCMCGVYDGTAFTCSEILKLHSCEFQAAMIIAATKDEPLTPRLQ
jgi:hypothetical protein